ncbi:MAG: SUMF1/EgtB/PvdO family nonheme iron enzyme [Lewinellaceae bacterium]|nr:SUMF1/EgtB/PvdO family nonheme iron enzyme [Lewinellaceae bacterium]
MFEEIPPYAELETPQLPIFIPSQNQLPPEIKSCIDNKKMILIEEGPFFFGKGKVETTSIDEVCAKLDNYLDKKEENPKATQGYLYSYYIDQTPVSNLEFDQFKKDTGHKSENWSEEYAKSFPNHPATGISYADAQAYANWAGKMLPTEPEWEKASRGSTGRVYPWGNDILTETKEPFTQIIKLTNAIFLNKEKISSSKVLWKYLLPDIDSSQIQQMAALLMSSDAKPDRINKEFEAICAASWTKATKSPVSEDLKSLLRSKILLPGTTQVLQLLVYANFKNSLATTIKLLSRIPEFDESKLRALHDTLLRTILSGLHHENPNAAKLQEQLANQENIFITAYRTFLTNSKTLPIGAHPETNTPEGIQDLVGNVFELVDSREWRDIHTSSRLKGGAFLRPGFACSTISLEDNSELKPYFGFRCVIPVFNTRHFLAEENKTFSI